ncbi:coiled-coil domain-containing protein 42 isoform X2 [Leptinotarsa decemlineata]|uniref:coiled-coil domain-containing protein 42 isoform X2 n=1 Tax=Leptinotarsa decemlineata TaxID=7539 RepID=UPI003D3041EB
MKISHGKMKNERSPRITFPKIKPQDAVLDYIQSKNMEKLDKLYPEFDVVRQNDPFSNLALLEIKLNKTERVLRQKRKTLVEARTNLDKQWKELDEKEKSLRENFKHFDQFVRENMEKRERALKKMKDDVALKEQRRNDIQICLLNYIEMKQAKFDMDAKIKDYRLYEDFLNKVVEHSEEFTSIQDMINRYLSLLNAKNSLAQLQEDNLKALENARSDMVKKMSEIDQVKASIWNVYTHMAHSKRHPVKIKKDNVEEQMMYIKRTLTELSKVNLILRKRSKSPAKDIRIKIN